jgi:hypothetical protein
MSVTACNFIGSTCSEDANQFATYTSTYELHTSERTDGPALIRQYASLPSVGSTYSTPHGDSDGSAVANKRDFTYRELDDTAKLWRAIIQFTNNPGGLPARDPSDPTVFPWNEPAEIETYTVKDKEPVLFDLNGKLIASSAGEPYDPVQERDRTRFTLRIARNVQFSDVGNNATYRDCINADPFFGCAPFTVKVDSPGVVKRLWFGGTPYYHETWEFAINTDGWLTRLYDYGMYRKVGDGANASLEAIRDLHNQPLSAPRLLNGTGGLLPVGSAPVFIRPDQTVPAIDYFLLYRIRQFAGLNLAQFF